jgi:arylsulfatase
MGAAARPNVILILTDDQGYGDIASHGNRVVKTPHIDRFRSESVRFTDFHAAPMCTPTRAQLMTGRDCLYTRAMNVSSGRTLLRRDIPTLAEAFIKSGYQTGIFGKWHLGDNYPYRPEDRGFQETVWFPSSHVGSVPDVWNNDYFNDTYRTQRGLKKFQGYCTDVFFSEAMNWMRARNSAREPFFTYLALNAAHGPLFVPPEYAAKYKDLPDRLARFYGMVSNIDDNIARLEEMLAATGMRGNTIVIYMTDNGPASGAMRYDGGVRGMKTELYEGGHRVPFFIRWPAGKIGGGLDIDELTHVQDVFPTLIDLCGLRGPSDVAFDGQSLAALMQRRSNSLPERTLVVQFSRMNAARPRKDDAAVMWKKWRLIHGNELYNIARDPGQRSNLYAEHPEIVSKLQAHYDRWWTRVEPLLDDFLPVHVGSDSENPTLVSACEWADVFLDQSGQVRSGTRKNGTWHVLVEKAGDYEIALRRWPREVDAALSDPLPEHRAEDGVLRAGVAIPIGQARLKIGSFDETIKVGAADREAVFRMRLRSGKTTMQSWFLDSAGQELLGAYYAYVERKDSGRAHHNPETGNTPRGPARSRNAGSSG